MVKGTDGLIVLSEFELHSGDHPIYPTSPLGQDINQGQLD